MASIGVDGWYQYGINKRKKSIRGRILLLHVIHCFNTYYCCMCTVPPLQYRARSFKAPPRIQETTGKFPELLVACQVSELILIQHLGLGCSTSFNSSTRLIKNDRALVHHQVRVNSRVAAYCCLLHVIGIQDNTAPAKLISAEVILFLFLHWDFYLICKTYLFFFELCGLFVLREWY